MKPRWSKKSPYRLLDVPVDASTVEIRDAWRRCVRLCHPDLHRDDQNPEKLYLKFVALTGAYALIGRVDRRRDWNAGRIRPDLPLVERTWRDLLRTAENLDTTGCCDEALEFTAAATLLAPKRWAAYLAHATILAHLERYDEAAKWIEKARRRGPHIPAVHYGAWLIGCRAGDFRTAWERMTAEIHIDETVPTPVAWFDVGVDSMRRFLGAERLWRFVRLFNPFGRWQTIRRSAGREIRSEAADDRAFVCCSVCAVLENLLDCF